MRGKNKTTGKEKPICWADKLPNIEAPVRHHNELTRTVDSIFANQVFPF